MALVDSFKRRIVMEWLNSTLAGSEVPPIGAACEAVGVQTSGMCPSPASRPEVGSIRSSPRQVKTPLPRHADPLNPLPAPLTPDQGLQLNQIARDKPCRDAKISQALNQQPCRIAARPRALLEGLLARLDAGLQPRHIANFVSHLSIQVKQKTDRSALPSREILKKRVKQRSRRIHRSIGFKIFGQSRRVCEWVILNSRLQKKLRMGCREKIRNEVHFDQKFVCFA